MVYLIWFLSVFAVNSTIVFMKYFHGRSQSPCILISFFTIHDFIARQARNGDPSTVLRRIDDRFGQLEPWEELRKRCEEWANGRPAA